MISVYIYYTIEKRLLFVLQIKKYSKIECYKYVQFNFHIWNYEISLGNPVIQVIGTSSLGSILLYELPSKNILPCKGVVE